jgi:hypothetical protein
MNLAETLVKHQRSEKAVCHESDCAERSDQTSRGVCITRQVFRVSRFSRKTMRPVSGPIKSEIPEEIADLSNVHK